MGQFFKLLGDSFLQTQIYPDVLGLFWFLPARAKLRGYTSCHVVTVACLLVLYSIKQFVKLPCKHVILINLTTIE
jgi:hypothetical protein